MFERVNPGVLSVRLAEVGLTSTALPVECSLRGLLLEVPSGLQLLVLDGGEVDCGHCFLSQSGVGSENLAPRRRYWFICASAAARSLASRISSLRRSS